MLKYLFLLTAFLFSVQAYSQTDTELQISKQSAYNTYKQTILVRLKTRKPSIDALRRMGNEAKANSIEEKQRLKNIEIIHAFRSNFDFCPVYFFYSDYSRLVKEKKLDSVPFLNEKLEADPNISVATEDFLIAEFGNIAPDTAKYFEGYYVLSGDGLDKRKPTYYHSSSEASFGALIIKSSDFVQMRSPFPYYVKTFDSFPIKRKPKKVVKIMNEKLHYYFSRNYKEFQKRD